MRARISPLANPRVAYTGGFACWAVGIPMKCGELVKSLPKVHCRVAARIRVGSATIYAEAYNKEFCHISSIKMKQTGTNESIYENI